jgi:oxalate decarboxylase
MSELRPENKSLLSENRTTNTPPPTDHGDIGPIWYSFDLARKRVEEGGWTHQITQRELPPSRDLAGVNMRLTSGSFRELRWHTADEWAFMEYGNARVTEMNPDGTMFIDDVSEGDLRFFPAGFHHSIQGLGPDGCQFLLVFDEGLFSFQRTTPSCSLNFSPMFRLMFSPRTRACRRTISRSYPRKSCTYSRQVCPNRSPRTAPPLAEAGSRHRSSTPFKMGSMAPTVKSAGGEVRIVDSSNFPVSTSIAAGLVRLKPGGMR